MGRPIILLTPLLSLTSILSRERPSTIVLNDNSKSHITLSSGLPRSLVFITPNKSLDSQVRKSMIKKVDSLEHPYQNIFHDVMKGYND